MDEIVDAALLARDCEISDFARSVFNGVEQNKQQIDGLIEENIIGWKKDRLSRVAVSVLRIALFEMLFEEGIPVSVSINEAVDLAKTYGTGDDASFINGVLGSVSRKLDQDHA